MPDAVVGERMALLLAASFGVGVAPGPEMPSTNFGLAIAMAGIIALAGALGTPIGLWLLTWRARLPGLNANRMVPTPLAVCFADACAAKGRIADVIVVAIFGIVGYMMDTRRCSHAHFVIGMVPATMIERNARRPGQRVPARASDRGSDAGVRRLHRGVPHRSRTTEACPGSPAMNARLRETLAVAFFLLRFACIGWLAPDFGPRATDPLPLAMVGAALALVPIVPNLSRPGGPDRMKMIAVETSALPTAEAPDGACRRTTHRPPCSGPNIAANASPTPS